jgi:regulator of sigma E protease
MNLLITLAAYIVTIGILIVVHEYGHYLAARLCGVKVLRFSMGFGKPLVAKRFKPDGTEWALAAFPFGGYVKMLDEREGEVAPAELPFAFNRKSVWRRILIVFAGPAANFLLAVLIYWVLFMHGIPGLRPVLGDVPADSAVAAAGLTKGDVIERIAEHEVQTWQDVNWALLRHYVTGGTVDVYARDENGRMHVETLRLASSSSHELERDLLKKLGFVPAKFAQPRLGEILPGSPAAAAGLRTGDWVRSVAGTPVSDWVSLVKEIRKRGAQPVRLEIMREGKSLNVVVTPRIDTIGGETAPRIGVSAYAFTMVSYGPLRALSESVGKCWDTSALSLQILGKMIIGEVSWRNLSGPVTTADFAGQTAQMGWLPYLMFLALISISLGIMNLLPIPVLDGGHLMYYMAEIVKGSPVSEQALALGQRVGIALILTLMLFAFYNDITRLLGH